jgi:hypothetical protein
MNAHLYFSPLCANSQFVLLLLETFQIEHTLTVIPFGASIPSSAVLDDGGFSYNEVPTLRLYKVASQQSVNLEDYRLIWYELEGRSFSPQHHAEARSILDYHLPQIQAEYTAPFIVSQAGQTSLLSAAQNLPLSSRLYYRYITLPRVTKFAQRTLSQPSSTSKTTLLVDNTSLTFLFQERMDKVKERIQNKYVGQATFI